MEYRSKIVPLADGAAAQVLTPQQVAQVYQYPVGSDGHTKCIGILSLDGGYSTADLQAAGIDPSRVTPVYLNGASNKYTGNPQSADLENILDLTIIGLAFAGKIKLFITTNDDSGIIAGIKAIMADPDVCCGSFSWGAAEQYWAAATASTVRTLLDGSKPFFVASGDNGPDDGTSGPEADFPACAEGATAVGGTKLILSSPTTAAETDWNDSMSGGGEEGYGYSKVIAAPTWQGGIGFRRVPDIVADAAPETCYTLHLNNQTIVCGGTSAAAPMAAAGYARLIEALGSSISNFNAAIYKATQTQFNAVSLVGGDPPYCVGLGSFNLNRLASVLQQQPAPTPPPTPTPAPPAPSACQVTVDAGFASIIAAIQAKKNQGDTVVSVEWYGQFLADTLWIKSVIDGILTAPSVTHDLAVPVPLPAPRSARRAKGGVINLDGVTITTNRPLTGVIELESATDADDTMLIP